MAWKIDRVLEWTPSSSVNWMEFDGRDVWVTTDSNVYVLGYWDENSDREGTNQTLYQYANIDLSSYLSNSPTTEKLGQIVKVDDAMYVAVHDAFDTVVLPDVTVERRELTKLIKLDIQTKAYDSTVTVTVSSAAPEIVAQNNKIWFTDHAAKAEAGNDRQKLYYYDTTGGSPAFSAGVEIAARKQFFPRVMANGRDEWVLVGSSNDNSIFKFSDTTGSLVNEIVTNRDPTWIHVNGSLEALVGGSDGMINKVIQSTSVVTAPYGLDGQATGGFVEEDDYIWAATPELARLDTSATGSPLDNYKLFTTNNNEDYAIDKDDFTETDFNQVLLTPQFDYQYDDGGSPFSLTTKTVRSYVFLLSNNYVYAFRTMPNGMTRLNTVSIRCTAMVGTGNERFYGETTA